MAAPGRLNRTLTGPPFGGPVSTGRAGRRADAARRYPYEIVGAVLEELRTTGSPQRVRAELARREQELHLRRLRSSAALHGYLADLGLAPG